MGLFIVSGCGAKAAIEVESPPVIAQEEPASASGMDTASTVQSVPKSLASSTNFSISPAVSQPIDWNQPSGGDYPVLNSKQSLWIHVSASKQKVWIMDDQTALYTMIASTGLDTTPDNSTPIGTFYIEKERGTWFYSGSEKEGAKYWVSWKNHGEFLFHTVPMDQDGHVIESEAEKLGQKASHGCIRLTIPDAKWIYDHIPQGTKVVID